MMRCSLPCPSQRADPLKWAPNEPEADAHKLAQRQKQIDKGKNTLGYDNYIKAVPREQRGKEHPRTPDVHRQCSKRAWDGLFKQWRRALHAFDPPGAGPDDALEPDDAAPDGADDVADLGACTAAVRCAALTARS